VTSKRIWDRETALPFRLQTFKTELLAKEGKQAAKMTRLSCHKFRSNEVRLWLTIIAYNLGNLTRRLFGSMVLGIDGPPPPSG
jgi:Transposase DDE domain group 1